MTLINRLLFIALLCASFAAQSEDIAAMKVMMKQQLMSSCDDTAFITCIGISNKKCVSAVNKAISSCDHLFPKDSAAMNGSQMDIHGDCLTENLLQNAGISESKLEACEAPGEGNSAAGGPPMNSEQAMAMFQQGLQQHAQAVGTKGVTLPLYKNATVMSHFANGEMSQMFNDVEPLPALVMSSPDSTDKIASFYRGKLKGFKEYKIEDGILFLQNGSKNFDMLKDMKVYVTTPHVVVSKDINGVMPGSKTMIEIAYKK